MNPADDPAIDRVLISEIAIRERVAELAAQLSSDFAGSAPLLVGVLTGGFVFMADLVRAMTIPVELDFMAVSSYGLATETSGVVRIVNDLDVAIEGRDVIIVEDIIDSGLTLRYLLDVFSRRGPRSLKVVALFEKRIEGREPVPVDYVGFQIPDEFVVGYGLDAGRRYRQLPYLAVYRPPVDAAAGAE